MNAMQVEAGRLRAKGFAITWLRPGDKMPRHRGWTKTSQEVDDYRDGDGLGIMTGALSGNLVCVDLDSDAALRLADEYLPHTGMIDGRPSRPRSHRYYRVTDIPADEISAAGPGGGPRARRFADAGIDFLGTGRHAVCPPTVVKNGEARAWEDADGEPATIRYADLRAVVGRLVAACSPSKRSPGRPKRQDVPGSVPTAGRPEPRLDAPDVSGVAPVAPGDPTPTPTPSCSTAYLDARAWMSKHEPAVSGRDGRRRAFVAARILVNDFALSADDAFPILAEWNLRCKPPWPEDELRATLARAAAAEPDPKYPRGCKLPPPPGAWNDPARLAREFRGAATWRLWHGTFWQYAGTSYEQQTDRDLADALTAYVQSRADDVYARMCRQSAARGEKTPTKPRVGRSLVADTLAQLRPLIKLPSTTRLPSFIGDASAPQLLAVRNGLLDLDTLAVLPHSPDWFSRNCLPFAYDPTATSARWSAVVARLLEDDSDRIALLQEWFGYCLWRGCEAQRFLILYGNGGTGKSTVLAALKAMVGADNLSAVSFADIGSNRFAYAPMLGMMINVSSDTSEIDRFAEGPFKSAVCGESMSIEFKGVDAFTAHPTAKLVLATNVLPRFSDKTDGVWRRALHLSMNLVIPPGDRVPGMDHESFWGDELPGLLNWSLAGLRRLRDNHWWFTPPAASVALAVEHRADSDPARAFLLEHLAYDPSAKPVLMADVYHQYTAWCLDGGVRHPLMIRSFNRCLRQAFPDVDESNVTYPKDHNRPGKHRSWVGLTRAAPGGPEPELKN